MVRLDNVLGVYVDAGEFFQGPKTWVICFGWQERLPKVEAGREGEGNISSFPSSHSSRSELQGTGLPSYLEVIVRGFVVLRAFVSREREEGVPCSDPKPTRTSITARLHL